MQKTTLIDVVNLQNDVAVTSSTSGGYNILVEGKGNEYDDGEEVDHGANCTHTLGDLNRISLAQVAALKASFHECRAKPFNHGIAQCERRERQSE